MAEYSKEEIRKIESKWRKAWKDKGVYKTSEDTSKPKYYVLDMFPYPSGAGLHVGHPLGYIASDIVARFKRIQGFNVLHPMGFDSFGLPAEQYAIQTGQHPAAFTQKNIETYKRQLDNIGFSFDWDRQVQTSDPSYYHWTQWIFMQLFNAWYNKKGDHEGRTEKIQTLLNEFERNGNQNVAAACDEETPVFDAAAWKSFNAFQRETILQKYRIAFQSETMVNWCPALGTVLSNDEVKDGVSERGGYPVERIKMLQWSMRISAYAERLLAGLDVIDWPDPLKEMQRNWIGKSIGCELDFSLASDSANPGTTNQKIKVFTTRIDTIYGVTFMVLAPEHELVPKITSGEQGAEVTAYIEIAKNRSERERMSEVKRISGAFTGAYALNPFNQSRIPVWISDYVLAGYGTGAVMGVPSSDLRDFAFAKHFGLEIINVLEGPASDITKGNFDPKSGTVINSDFLNGLSWKDAIDIALQKVESSGIGLRKINYRMRDAIFGRQRYWGEPFPVYFKNNLPTLVDEQDLPIILPEIDAYKPTETGEPPLARAKDWTYHPSAMNGSSPAENSGGYAYELTTMPGWAGSSWYWFRYMDPHNKSEFVSKEKELYWKDVDLYIGGSEHATGHLLYSRFWCKALRDLGFVEADEPFKKLINQGHILGVSEKVYFSGQMDNEKVAAVFSSNTFVLPGNKSPRIFSTGDELAALYYSYEVYQKIAAVNPKLAEGIAEKHVPIALVENNRLNIDAFVRHNSAENIAFINEKGWLYKGEFKEFATGELSASEFVFQTRSEVEKMSKSKLNVINPDDLIDKYGADTLRMYEMFLGPLEQSKPWNTNGIDGVYKFLRKFWNLWHDPAGSFVISEEAGSAKELKILHKTLKKVENDIESFSFNTSVSEMMICVNELTALKCNKRSILEPLVIALSPFAPHVAEELWEKSGHPETILKSRFVKHDEQYLRENDFVYPISINGKVRTMINFPLDMPKEDMEKVVLASEIVQKWSEGKLPRKVIIVQGKIVNIVV